MPLRSSLSCLTHLSTVDSPTFIASEAYRTEYPCLTMSSATSKRNSDLKFGLRFLVIFSPIMLRSEWYHL